MQWQIQGWGGAGGPAPPPLLLDQTEARRAEKIFFGDRHPSSPPPPLPFPFSLGLDDRAPPLSEGLDSPLQMVPLSHTKFRTLHPFYLLQMPSL